MTFDCNFTEFKKRAMEFHKALPSMNLEEMENAHKCLTLSYLGMYESLWLTSAAIVLNMESKAYIEREYELGART